MEDNAPLLASPATSQRSPRLFEECLEPRRWWILICFFLYGCFSFSMISTYTNLSRVALQYFNIDENQLIRFSNANFVTMITFSYIGAWFAYKRFKATLLTLLSLVTIGGWVCYLAGTNYYWALLGQILACIGASPFYGIATLLPEIWFSARERLLVTTIALYAADCGGILSQSFSLLFVHDNLNRVHSLILLQAILVTIPLVLGIFFIRNRPKIPPSYSAFVELLDPAYFWKGLRTLLKQSSYVTFLLGLGTTTGVASASFVIAMTVRAHDIPDRFLNMSGILFHLSGILAGLLNSLHLSRKSNFNYDPVIKILLSLALVALALFGAALDLNIKDLVIILFFACLTGAGLNGQTPFIYSSAAESTFPVPESVSGNTLSIYQSIVTLIINQIAVLPQLQSRGLYLLAGILIPCWIYAVLFFKTDYRKQKLDAINQEINTEALSVNSDGENDQQF